MSNNPSDVSVKTVVQKHQSRQFNGKTFYSFVGQDGKSYGTKLKKPPPEGSYVEFFYSTNPKGYAEVSDWQILPQPANVKAEVARAAVAAAKTVTKDDYWTNREARDVAYQERQLVTQKTIELQSCRNTAVELVKLLLEREAVPVPKAKADQEEYIVTMVDRYTKLFLEQNNNNKDNKNDDQTSTTEPTKNELDPTSATGAEWA